MENSKLGPLGRERGRGGGSGGGGREEEEKAGTEVKQSMCIYTPSSVLETW